MTPPTHLLLGSLLLALLAACAPSPRGAASTGGAGEQAVREAIEALNAATSSAVARGDAEAIAAHYREDALMLPAGSDFITGREAIRRQFRKAMASGLAGLRFDMLSLEVSGNLAVETGRYEAIGDAGQSLDHGKYVVVWQQAADGWQIARDVSTTSRLPPVATPEAGPLPALRPADSAAAREATGS